MWVYLLGTALYMGLTYLLYFIKNNFSDRKWYKPCFIALFILSVLPLILISGLRYNVGTDYNHTYAPHFIEKNWDYSEKVFIWINQFFRLFTANPVILFLFMATVTQVFIQLAIIKVSPNWWVSSGLFVFCNFFAVSLNQSRQIMCIAIIAYAITFIHQKKLIPYLILVLLASSMHYSCLVFLPIYFIARWNFVKRNLPFIIIICACATPVLALILKPIIMLTKYSYFLTDPNYMTNQSIIAYFTASFVVGAASIMYYKSLVEKYGILAIVNVLLNGIALCVGIMGFFLRVPELMARIYLLFSISQIFLIPMIISVEEKVSLKISLLIILVCGVTMPSAYVIFIQKHHEIFPYQWIFNK